MIGSDGNTEPVSCHTPSTHTAPSTGGGSAHVRGAGNEVVGCGAGVLCAGAVVDAVADGVVGGWVFSGDTGTTLGVMLVHVRVSGLYSSVRLARLPSLSFLQRRVRP